MEYLAMAYALIAIVLIGYAINLQRRMAAIERARKSIQAQKD